MFTHVQGPWPGSWGVWTGTHTLGDPVVLTQPWWVCQADVPTIFWIERKRPRVQIPAVAGLWAEITLVLGTWWPNPFVPVF